MQPQAPHIDDRVRLTQDIPELSLARGEIGVVRSQWFSPTIAYEVEFHKVGLAYDTRALLLQEQLALEDDSSQIPAQISAEAELPVPWAG